MSATRQILPLSTKTLKTRIRGEPIRKFPGGKGPEDRLKQISTHLTQLVREERIELPYWKAKECEGYMNKLIELGKKYGEKHNPSFKLVDYYLREKDLLPKFYKLLLKRYENFDGPYTKVYKLTPNYPSWTPHPGILELVNNPLPPLNSFVEQKVNPFTLTNQLISAMRNEKKLNMKIS
ncbi:hypothetical protein SNEBB_009790 [Seison nebaliae]|nr:hypothetical protein SNEBB_009790 [Seison nebaliae]